MGKLTGLKACNQGFESGHDQPKADEIARDPLAVERLPSPNFRGNSQL